MIQLDIGVRTLNPLNVDDKRWIKSLIKKYVRPILTPHLELKSSNRWKIQCDLDEAVVSLKKMLKHHFPNFKMLNHMTSGNSIVLSLMFDEVANHKYQYSMKG